MLCMHTFSGPMTVELVFWQLEFNGAAGAEYVGIHLLVIRNGVDLFTKRDSFRNPACLVLTLRRKLSGPDYALV